MQVAESIGCMHGSQTVPFLCLIIKLPITSYTKTRENVKTDPYEV